MELRHLRYFVAVAEELHFGRAAQRLNLSQPPLSQQIQALEAELDTRLLERTNRRVALTDAGRLFLDEARQILAASERAAERVRRAGRGETGQLQVGFSASSPFVATIPKTLFAYRRAYPEVRLQLQEMSSREQIDAMLAGNLQIGLIRPIELPAALVAVELFREPLVVALRYDHPLARQGTGPLPMAALAEEPFVYFPRTFGTGLYEQVHTLAARAGFTPRIVQEASEVLIILGLVAAGLGVTVLPATYQRTQMEGLVYRELDDPEATSAVWLLRRRDEVSPQAEAFVGLLFNKAAKAQLSF